MKRFRVNFYPYLFILFIGIGSTLHSQNSVGENIVQNPGFINDFEGWKTLKRHISWRIASEGKDTPKSAVLDGSESYFRGELEQSFGSVTAGNYSLSFYCKISDNRLADAQLYVNHEWHRLTLPVSTEWQKVIFPDIYVSSEDNLTLRIFFQGSIGDEAWFDDFKLYLVSKLPAPAPAPVPSGNMLGRFNIDKDLLLIHHDNYRDVDDIHGIGAHGTMLRDSRFANVNYYAVGGTYGQVSGGTWYDVSHLMNLCFGSKWTECHLDWDGSVNLIAVKVENTLKNGGRVWISEGGQSDFSAAVGRKVKQNYPKADLKQIHLVQHHPANEAMTTYADLMYSKENFTYHYIDVGNNFGADNIALSSWMESDANNSSLWNKVKTDPKIMDIWKEVETQVEYWLSQEGTLSEGILGEFGFPDAITSTWTFGFNQDGNGTIKLYDCKSFFNEFGTLQY